MFRRLSIFTGGFDLASAEEVCANEFLTKDRIIDILPRLIDTCLVQTGYTEKRKMRYNQLETLRQYGMKILSEKEENEEVSRKHLEYLAVLLNDTMKEVCASLLDDKIQLENNNFLAAPPLGRKVPRKIPNCS